MGRPGDQRCQGFRRHDGGRRTLRERQRQTDTRGDVERRVGRWGKEKTGGMEARGRQGVGGWKEDKTGLRLGR